MPPSDPVFPIPFEAYPNGVQSREVPGTATATSTGAYRLSALPDLVDIDTRPDFPKTLFEGFNRSLKLRPDRPLYGWRATIRETGELANSFSWMNTAEVDQHRTLMGSGLLHLVEKGVIKTEGGKTGWTIANWMPNRPEWQLVNHTAAAYSLVMTSLYDTLGPGVVEYCINHADVKVTFANPQHIPTLIQMADKIPNMKLIVCADNWDSLDLKNGGKAVGGLPKSAILKKWGESKGITIMDLAELETIGRDHPHDFVPPKPEALQSIMYTSGTTGMPKGALITHRNIMSASIGQLYGNAATEAGDCTLGYLPLSHIYEQFVEVVGLLAGYQIGYACGDMTRLIEDIQLIKPHTMVAVPRVLNRFYQVIKAATLDAPGVKGALSRRAFDSAIAQLEAVEPSLPGPLNVYDKLVFRKVRAAFGGRLKFMSSGSAPIAPEVLKFFKVAFGRNCMLVEGYGQTEGMGTATRGVGEDLTAFGYVGPPLACCEMKLEDVPDMAYLHTDKPYPRGEILMRGPNIFPGYHKDEKNTKETITEDGWLRSGDIGEIDAKGRLKIIDRKKNLLKLSQGEYVALEKVENTYALCPFIAQIYIHGDSLRDHLVAIVAPEPIAFEAFLKRNGRSAPSSGDTTWLAKQCEDPQVKQIVMTELESYHKGKLAGFEQVKAVHLQPELFHESLLTPTFKIKRQVAGKYFKEIIDKMYSTPLARQAVGIKRSSKL